MKTQTNFEKASKAVKVYKEEKKAGSKRQDALNRALDELETEEDFLMFVHKFSGNRVRMDASY